MTPVPGKPDRPRRSAAFFVSDVNDAAEQAAAAVRDHGLHHDLEERLAEVTADAISSFFADAVWD